MKSILRLTAALIAFGLSGCGESDNGEHTDDFQVVESNLERELSPDVSSNDLAELASGNTLFALQMYQKLADEYTNENLFFSPYSISIALAMTYAGAEGETEKQMAETLHFTLSEERLHPAFNQEDLILNSRGEGAQGVDDEPFCLRVVNSIWGSSGIQFLSSFLDTMAVNYGAGLRVLDFIGAAEQSRIDINGWVEEQTETRIQDLLPEGSLTGNIVMVLVNAVYFNAGWSSKFKEQSTKQSEFTNLSGAKVTSQLMNQQEGFAYYKGDGYQALELLYDGQQMSMVLLVPDTGMFGEFERGLSVETMQETISGLEMKSVKLSMPKWEFESESLSIKKIFVSLGMGIAFSREADFSGMVQDGGIWINDIYHKSFIIVEEGGTEAAAATAVVMANSAPPSSDVVLAIDRPFIYYIRDIETNTIVFMGRVANPN